MKRSNACDALLSIFAIIAIFPGLSRSQTSCPALIPCVQEILVEQAVSINTDVLTNTTFYPIPQAAITVSDAPVSIDTVTTVTWLSTSSLSNCNQSTFASSTRPRSLISTIYDRFLTGTLGTTGDSIRTLSRTRTRTRTRGQHVVYPETETETLSCSSCAEDSGNERMDSLYATITATDSEDQAGAGPVEMPATITTGAELETPRPSALYGEPAFILGGLGMGGARKRQQNSNTYITNAGTLTSDCSQVPSYALVNGTLLAFLNNVTYVYSTDYGVPYQLFAPSTISGPINTTFYFASNNVLSWQDESFFNGAASFCSLNGSVYAVFQQGAQPEGCFFLQLSLFTFAQCQAFGLNTISGPTDK